MSPVRATKNAMSAISERVRWWDLVVSFLANLGAMAALAILLWSIFSGAALNKVTGVMKEELGTEEMLKTTKTNSAKIDKISAQLQQHLDTMADAFPIKVAYIDEHLSHIEDGCRQFTECTAVLFVRRYDQWLHCKAPLVLNHSVMDVDGIIHPVTPSANNRSQRQGSSLARVVIRFIPDNQVPPGLAFFTMILQYDCGDQFIEQATHPIRFDLLPARQKP